MVKKNFDPAKVLQHRRLCNLCMYLFVIMPLFPVVVVGQNNQERHNGQQISAVKSNTPPGHHFSEGELIRQSGTPAIYVIEKGTRRLIPDLKTFNARSYSWKAIKEVSAKEMLSISEGKQIPSTGTVPSHRLSDGELIRQSGTPAIYVIERGKRRLIPNLKTFNARKYSWEAIKNFSGNEMLGIPEGPPIPSVM